MVRSTTRNPKLTSQSIGVLRLRLLHLSLPVSLLNSRRPQLPSHLRPSRSQPNLLLRLQPHRVKHPNQSLRVRPLLPRNPQATLSRIASLHLTSLLLLRLPRSNLGDWVEVVAAPLASSRSHLLPRHLAAMHTFPLQERRP